MDDLAALSAPILERAMRAARATVVVEDDIAYTVDPVFPGLRRNRVNAELLKAALRLPAEEAKALGYPPDLLDKLAERIARSQSPDGCWHEIHPRYDQPSALATAFMAEALLAHAEARGGSRDVEARLGRARDYILAAEMRPGFFLKSEGYRADHLNVDASCGAFLAAYSAHAKDAAAEAAARRAARHVVAEQFEDGAWPYTTADPGPPYPEPIHVPCIHYQGVTAYYLGKIADAIDLPDLERSLLRGADWLATVQGEDGRFDWRRSQMMFAYQLSGAYAFAAETFRRAGRKEEARRALVALAPQVPALAWRWERGGWTRLPRDGFRAFRAGASGPFRAKTKAMRVGYGLYRQLARAREADRVHDGLFHILRRTFGLTVASVEPSRNFPDLFMTSEIVDCLSAVAMREAPEAPTP